MKRTVKQASDADSQRIEELFEQSIEVKTQAKSALSPLVVRGANLMLSALDANRKVLSCGNGGSAADAQHFAAELVCRFESARQGLAAVALSTDTSALTAISNDFGFADVFARQVEALGQGGDVLLAITTSGDSPNITSAIEAAHDRDMQVVLLSGKQGGAAARKLHETDVELRVEHSSTARIQEVHILLLHCFCHLIDCHYSGVG